MKHFNKFVLFSLVLLLAVPLHASSFKVHPLRFEFSDKNRTAIFKLTNTTDHSVTVQLSSAKWLQDDQGNDSYTPTSDIVFFPRIVKIEQGEERIVRLGYRGQPADRAEGTYRLFAQELPPRGERNNALNFAFRFSLPIFIIANRAPAPVEKMLGAQLIDGQLRVWMVNEGGRHYMVKTFSTRGTGALQETVFEDSTGGWYVLANAKKQFSIPLDEAGCAQSQLIDISIVLDKKKIQTRVPVNRQDCKKPEVRPEQLVTQ